MRVTTTESPWSRPSRVLWGERRIQLYDAGSGLTRGWFRGGSDVRFTPDGTAVATLGDGPIRLYRLPARPSLVLVFGGATVAALLIAWILRRWAALQRRRAATVMSAPPLGPTSNLPVHQSRWRSSFLLRCCRMPYTWTLSDGGMITITITLQVGGGAAPVPEPSTLALLR